MSQSEHSVVSNSTSSEPVTPKNTNRERATRSWLFAQKSSGKMIQKRTSILSGLVSLQQIPLAYATPHPEEEQMSGTLEKLKACDSDLDDLWDSRRAVLSEKLLCFTPLDSIRTVSDCIPTHEISQVSYPTAPSPIEYRVGGESP
jgi:hypothetical protein